MPLEPVYLVAIKNLQPFLDALRRAQAPGKVALRFIHDLGFKSTNDRLFIPLLKAMKFLDESGKPTARYHSFLDDNEWKRVLADGVRDAYADLFRINKNAHAFTREQLVGKIKSLGEGKLSPAVLGNMSKTFLQLVKLADFSQPPSEAPLGPELPEEPNDEAAEAANASVGAGLSPKPQDNMAVSSPSLVYRIEIVLPAVRDQLVYDAIFRSVRQHLFC